MSELAEVTWDLEDLLGDHAAERPEDAVGALLDEAEREAGEFAERYEGKVADLDGDGLREAMSRLAGIDRKSVV